jgi:hypothetical protein
MAMGQNNGNGNPPKVELELNQEARFRILKPVYAGQSSFGKFFLYSVKDLETGETRSLFATEEIHSIIEEKQLGVGSEFLLKRVLNGKKGSSKLELSIVGKALEHQEPSDDNLRVIMEKCLKDAVEVTKAVTTIPFQNEDVRAICSCLFIARTR